jgi:carbamoyltransferase
MRVLGISPLDKDSTASFVEDGKVVFACGEERLSRTKLQDGFPERAIRLGLERTGWSPESIDQVAYAFFDAQGESRLIEHSMKIDSERYRAQDTAESLNRLNSFQRSRGRRRRFTERF